MQATHQAKIQLAPQLSPAASTGHVLDGLSTGSLLSIGKLCDDDCAALFTKYHVHIIKDGTVIIKGPRNPTKRLWSIPFAPKCAPLSPSLTSVSEGPEMGALASPSLSRGRETHTLKNKIPSRHPVNDTAASAIRSAATKADLATFLHACLFSPMVATLLRAIQRGHFVTFPGLTVDLIRRHLLKSTATTKGHMRGQQQNIPSTKISLPSVPLATSLDISPSSEPSNPRTMDGFCFLSGIQDMREPERSYSDQTGRFPVPSQRGNNYVFVFYDYDANAILTEALPDRSTARPTRIFHS
jgi:hypothetical protein